jgi:N-methylhydantoinase A
VNVDLKRLDKDGLDAISKPFDVEHTRLFTFALPLEHEFVSVRAVVHGKGVNITRQKSALGKPDPSAAAVGKQKVFMEGRDYTAIVYDRAKLKAGARVAGPAIVMEMDSTSVILPKHTGLVDAYANILIYPDSHAAVKGKGVAKAKPAAKPKVKAAPAKAKAKPKAAAKGKTQASAKRAR